MATPPDFSPGQVLTAAHMDAVGLWKITPTSVSGTGASISGSDVVVSSGGANFTVNGVFSADFRNYKIVISDARFSGPSGIFLSMGTSATGSSYKYAQVNVSSAGVVGGSGNAAGSYFDCPIVSRSTTDSAGGEITLFSPFESIETSIVCSGSDSDNSAIMRQMSGRLINNTSYTSCYFALSGANTYSAITVSFYGYR